MNNGIWQELTSLDFTLGVCPCADMQCRQLAEYRRRVHSYLTLLMIEPAIDRAVKRLHHLAGYDGKTM